MEKEELMKLADQELQFLKYYALANVDQTDYPGKNGRTKFDVNRSPYDQLVSIGYTKRVLSLDRRCALARLTSNTPVKESSLDDIFNAGGEPRDHDKNIFTAVEVLLLKCPEEHQWVIDYLS